MSTLALTRVVSGATISSTTENNNQAALEAVVNGGIEADNLADDAVDKAELNSSVVNAGGGLKQETDGSLSVDPSDTNPCVEVTDGGLRVKVDDSSIERASGGIQLKASGVSTAKIADNAVTADKIVDDLVFSTFPLTPSAAPDADYEIPNKKYVDDQIAANARALSSWESRNVGQTYQASTDGFFKIFISCADGAKGLMQAYTDSNSSPSTQRGGCCGADRTVGNINGEGGDCIPVKAGDYYKVTSTTILGSPTYGAFWIPLS